MERAGTDLDKYQQIEREVHELGREIAEVREETRASMVNLGAEVHSVKRQQDDHGDLLKDISAKLDEQRTRRPDLNAIFASFIGLAGLGAVMLAGMWTLFQAQLRPIEASIAEHGTGLRGTYSQEAARDLNTAWQRRFDSLWRELKEKNQSQDARIGAMAEELGDHQRTLPHRYDDWAREFGPDGRPNE